MFDLPWIAIFVLGSPWIWLLGIVASCFVTWAIEEDSGVLATVVLVVSILLTILFGSGLEWLKWITFNPHAVLFWILGYVACGSFWGIIKWYFFALDELEKFENQKISWLKKKDVNLKKVPVELQDEWTNFVCNNTDFGHWQYIENNKKIAVFNKPQSWNNKARIVRWMSYWPFSVIWTLLDDIVKKIFRYIQKWLGNLMDYITNFVWRHADDDFGLIIKKEDKDGN